MIPGQPSKFRVDENESDRVSDPVRAAAEAPASDSPESCNEQGAEGAEEAEEAEEAEGGAEGGEEALEDDDFDRESVCLRELTDEQFEELITEAFNDVDEDNSGIIASEHLGSIMDSLSEEGVIVPLYSDDELDLLKNDMDADQNGMIPLSEFKDVLFRRRAGMDFTDAELQEAFGVFDFKEQGTFTQYEYRQVMQAVLEVEVPALDAKSMVMAASRNGEDKIDLQEFMDIIRWQKIEPD